MNTESRKDRRAYITDRTFACEGVYRRSALAADVREAYTFKARHVCGWRYDTAVIKEIVAHFEHAYGKDGIRFTHYPEGGYRLEILR